MTLLKGVVWLRKNVSDTIRYGLDSVTTATQSVPNVLVSAVKPFLKELGSAPILRMGPPTSPWRTDAWHCPFISMVVPGTAEHTAVLGTPIEQNRDCSAPVLHGEV